MAKKNKSKTKKATKKSSNSHSNTSVAQNSASKSNSPKSNSSLNFKIEKISTALTCDFYLVKGNLSTKSKYAYTYPIMRGIYDAQEQGGISLEELSQALYGDTISRIHKLKQVIADLKTNLIIDFVEDKTGSTMADLGNTIPNQTKVVLTKHGLELFKKDSSFSPVEGQAFLLVTCDFPLLATKVLACKPLLDIDKFGEEFGQVTFTSQKYDANIYWHPGYNAKFLMDKDGNPLLEQVTAKTELELKDLIAEAGGNVDDNLLTLKFAQEQTSELVFTDLDTGKSCMLDVEELLKFTPYAEPEATDRANHRSTNTTLGSIVKSNLPLQPNLNQVTVTCVFTDLAQSSYNLKPDLNLDRLETNPVVDSAQVSTPTPGTSPLYLQIKGDFTYQYLFGGENKGNSKFLLKINETTPVVKGFDAQFLNEQVKQQVISTLKTQLGNNFDEKRGYIKVDARDYENFVEQEIISGCALYRDLTCKNVRFSPNLSVVINELQIKLALPVRPLHDSLAKQWLIDLVYYETKSYHMISETVFNSYMQSTDIPILQVIKDQLKLKRFYRKDLIRLLKDRFSSNSITNNSNPISTKSRDRRELELYQKLRHGQFWNI